MSEENYLPVYPDYIPCFNTQVELLEQVTSPRYLWREPTADEHF